MPESAAPIGVLLVNLGTPDSPETGDVRRYLREFLSDPRVIDIHPVGRWLLLNLIILPFRPKASGEAYRAIWTEQGSPLLIHGRGLAEGVSAELGEAFRVELAMRYGRPSIPSAIDRLARAGCDRLVVLPLYPQAASSSSGSTLEAVYAAAGQRWDAPLLSAVPAFFDDDGWVEVSAALAREAFEGRGLERIVFSYHGVPERHVRKSDPSGSWCLESSDCCARLRPENRGCYRAQCFEQSRLVAERLGLDVPWEVAFQSRLGRTPWIRPYTDERLAELAAEGVKRVGLVSGSFVADCLETLEELGIRAREDFLAAGGEELVLAPCANSDPRWVRSAAQLVRKAAGAWR